VAARPRICHVARASGLAVDIRNGGIAGCAMAQARLELGALRDKEPGGPCPGSSLGEARHAMPAGRDPNPDTVEAKSSTRSRQVTGLDAAPRAGLEFGG
jgi:hypothetical protein